MEAYFCVTSAYYDNGKVTFDIIDLGDFEHRPNSSCKETRTRSIYIDWLNAEEVRRDYPELAKKYSV